MTPRINQPRVGEPAEPELLDPLKLCIFTTIALIAWLVSPPVAVVGFASIGLWGYAKARRAGLMKSRCVLGDTRLVMVYLGVAWLAGAWFVVRGLVT